MLSLSKTIKKQPTGRILALGFLAVILAGSLLLMLPVCRIDGAELRYIDSLFTATSAVCVTGLVTVDVASTFSPLGQFVVALLIQIGGLGVASAGAALFLIMGKRVSIKGRSLLKDGLNLGSGGGIVRMLKTVLFSTLIIEGIGAFLAFLIFLPDYPLGEALGKGIFHAVSAFNNAGFDTLGDFKSLLDYSAHIPMNLLTAALIILGGIGFPVIAELREKRLRPKSLSLHSKVVIWFSFWLIVIGAIITKLIEGTSWLEALFHSVSLRTAGFSTLNLAEFTEAGLLISCFFMVVGASPGSTGGGIKTTTLFALLQGLRASATGSSEKAFHYSVPKDAFRKAATIITMVLGVIIAATVLLLLAEPTLTLSAVLFEVCSAVGTVGLSTGITPGLGALSKAVLMAVMFIGRLGPLTIASLWHFAPEQRVQYAEGDISIG